MRESHGSGINFSHENEVAIDQSFYSSHFANCHGEYIGVSHVGDLMVSKTLGFLEVKCYHHNENELEHMADDREKASKCIVPTVIIHKLFLQIVAL